MDSQSTPISELLGSGQQESQLQNPTGQFGQLPGQSLGGPQQAQQHAMQMQMQMPVMNQVVQGPGQGISAPDISGGVAGGVKEFFGLKETDYKTIIIVFAVILLASSGILNCLVKLGSPGSFTSDGKITISGTLIVSLICLLIYFCLSFGLSKLSPK